jgi:hypothetical protein
MRTAYSSTKNVVNNPLIIPKKVYLPPLHIKLGLVKNFPG